MDPAPVPTWLPRFLDGALAIATALALASALFAGPLRVLRLYEEGTAVAVRTVAEAEREVARKALIDETLAQEREKAAPLLQRLLAPDEERLVRDLFVSLAKGVDFEVADLRLGTRRPGAPLDAVPLYAELRGEATALPPFFADFYAQRRLLRLVAMDVQRRGDPGQVALRMQWEYGTLPRADAPPPDPAERFSAPVVFALISPDSLPTWLDGARRQAESQAARLVELQPELRAVAAAGAAIEQLRARRLWLEAWERSGAAEGRAILRRLPELIQRAERQPERRAGLRPAAGGNLEIVEG